MNAVATPPTDRPLTLRARTAAELMTPNPISIRDAATVRDALRTLIDRGFSAAPVIDRAGRPVGVLSRTDILVHRRENADYLATIPEYYGEADVTPGAGPDLAPGTKDDTTTVADIMTPVVFSVTPETPAARAVADMVGLKVHRLFVVDADGVLVGVISALDVLRHLGT